MTTHLFYNTPVNKFQTHYPKVIPLFGKFGNPPGGQTQLPGNVAAIRVYASLAFTSLLTLALGASLFSLPIIVTGAAFAGWTIYSNVYTSDPLMEAFYKICGGKDKFYTLPKIDLKLTPDKKFSETIEELKWEDLNDPISKTKTLDGRNVIIIKGLDRVPYNETTQTKGVLVFVEKLSPEDRPEPKVSSLAESIMHAIFAPHKGNTFGREIYSKYSSSSKSFGGEQKESSSSSYCKVYSSISSDMANEFYAQMCRFKKEK